MKGVGESQNLFGAIKIILYMIKQVSINRYNDLKSEILKLIQEYNVRAEVKNIIQTISGLDEKDFI